MIKKQVRVGRRVRVAGGSGVDSDKLGTVVCRCNVEIGWRGVPTNVQGAYKPVDWSKEVAVQLDDGNLITIYKTRLIVLT